ncbi:hypothetical protein I5J49_gp43 [Mycobacterium phage ThulaThula]|uniref:Uncharacterized protein n=1 Tax=Mycobacterium phage ThulaThula TaxID=2599880 RepID=A0A5J6TE07_9CAUD|nr:hypothetical protein I5J49_gp43 [Mycobacterium phage ThulaThula]QFG09071.1 hypothetical protein PBI_THULATHULA_43 [Mycobacterium phage ThulaThula]
MTLPARLNAAANEAIHRGLAGFGRLILGPLEEMERRAMANALNRDYGFTYDDAVTAAADALADDEAEFEVQEAPSKCRVCTAGEYGQRLHKCPDSPYYIPGSDPGAELPAPPMPMQAGHADLAAHITATFASIPNEVDDIECADLIASALLADFHITPK